MKIPMTPEALAQFFHDTYERLAPMYGYETQASTKIFDPNSPNGKLMIAVCAELITAYGLVGPGGTGEVIKRKYGLTKKDWWYGNE